MKKLFLLTIKKLIYLKKYFIKNYKLNKFS